MPPETWPSSLQQLLDRDFQESQNPRSLTSDVAIGPKKKRLVYTKSMPVLNCNILADMVDYQTFQQFYNINLGGGTKTFYFLHPITRAQLTYRFSEEPTISAVGPIHFRISMQWEQL